MSETQTRSWRCLDRLIKVCERQGRPYWIGSWDEDTNHRLQERLDPQHRLPRFRKTDHALDGSHPGPLTQIVGRSDTAYHHWLTHYQPTLQYKHDTDKSRSTNTSAFQSLSRSNRNQ